MFRHADLWLNTTNFYIYKITDSGSVNRDHHSTHTPGDVAHSVRFLVSDAARYIIGETTC